MSSHRWMKFWPADWQSDAALRMCSLAARGLWMEMLCLGHSASEYGHVLVNGRAVMPRQLAVLVGTTEADVVALLAELEDAGVFSRTPEGVIYSRRMVRDKAASELGRDNGKAGGNPTLKGNRRRTVNGSAVEADNPGDSDGDNPSDQPGGLTPPLKLEAEAESESENYPLTPKPEGLGGQNPSRSGRAPPRRSRAAGTNPRAVAAAEAAARPPPPEPSHPLWPGMKARGMSAAVFASTVGRLAEAPSPNGHAVWRAPSRFLADHIRAEHRIAIEAVTGRRVEIVWEGEAVDA